MRNCVCNRVCNYIWLIMCDNWVTTTYGVCLRCVKWFYKSRLHSLHLFRGVCVCVCVHSSSCRLLQHYRVHTSLSTLQCSLLQWRLVETYLTHFAYAMKYTKVLIWFFIFIFLQENSSQPQVESSGDHSPYAYQQTKWWIGTAWFYDRFNPQVL